MTVHRGLPSPGLQLRAQSSEGQFNIEDLRLTISVSPGLEPWRTVDAELYTQIQLPLA